MKLADEVRQLEQMMKDILKSGMEDIDREFAGQIGPDQVLLNDVELMTAMAMMAEMAPPRPFLTPEGHRVVASPAHLALSLSDRGKKDLDRYKRLTGGR